MFRNRMCTTVSRVITLLVDLAGFAPASNIIFSLSVYAVINTVYTHSWLVTWPAVARTCSCVLRYKSGAPWKNRTSVIGLQNRHNTIIWKGQILGALCKNNPCNRIGDPIRTLRWEHNLVRRVGFEPTMDFRHAIMSRGPQPLGVRRIILSS